jgi:hypothetical protein
MRTLIALLFLLNATLVGADAPPGDEIEEIRLQRELSEKAAAYLHDNEAAIQKFTGKDPQEFANDPALQQAVEDDKAAFEQRQQEIENGLAD